MTIKFRWVGSKHDTAGIASYSVEGTSIEYTVQLPSFTNAQTLHSVLTRLYSDGIRLGKQEMKNAVSVAMQRIFEM